MITMPLMQNYGSELSPDIINNAFKVFPINNCNLIDNEVWCAGITLTNSYIGCYLFITPDCIYWLNGLTTKHRFYMDIVSSSHIRKMTSCAPYCCDSEQPKVDIYGNANVTISGIGTFYSYVSPEGIDFCGPNIIARKSDNHKWEPMFAMLKKHAGGSFQPLIDNYLNRRMYINRVYGPCDANSWGIEHGFSVTSCVFYYQKEYNNLVPPWDNIFHPNAFKSVSFHTHTSCNVGLAWVHTAYDSYRKKNVTGIVLGSCNRTEIMFIFRL